MKYSSEGKVAGPRLYVSNTVFHPLSIPGVGPVAKTRDADGVSWTGLPPFDEGAPLLFRNVTSAQSAAMVAASDELTANNAGIAHAYTAEGA